MYILINFPNDGKQIRKFITALLKSQTATEIKRLNYISSYTLIDQKIKKKEEKLLVIFFQAEKETKLKNLIKKLHPDPNFFIQHNL